MSIRHYTPRRRARGGASPLLIKVMAVALGLAILMQIAYPLVEGTALQVITVASVYLAALAMFLHGVASYGARYGLTLLGITLVFGFLIEQIGVTTSWPFGEYTYSSTLGAKLLSVPLVVPFAWVMIAHPCLVAARRIGKSWVFLYGALLMTAWDLFLDPLMVTAGRWTWVVTGAHVPFQPEIPLSNTFGWLLSTMALMTILHFATPQDRRKVGGSLIAADVLLFWTWFSGVVGNLFFFDRPGIALFSGAILGVLLVPYFFNRWVGRP
jgi:putative membrane protein